MMGKNDQTAKADAGKLQLSLVPTQIIKDVAEVRMYGHKKYGNSENTGKRSKSAATLTRSCDIRLNLCETLTRSMRNLGLPTTSTWRATWRSSAR